MQKVAVALTTQEEFNEYIRYAEKMWRKRASWDRPWDYDNREEYWSSALLLLWDKFSFVSDAGDRKIISLKEAIGEKESKHKCKWLHCFCSDCISEAVDKRCINKEVIREGEARLKKYKHKTLWREARQMDDKPDYYYIYKQLGEGAMSASKASREADFPNREIVYCIDKQLIESSSDWEPIEDTPKREWRIDDARKDFTDNTDYEWFNDERYFREAIEKHMPKLSREEVSKYVISEYDKSLQPQIICEITEFLKSKWLLE